MSAAEYRGMGFLRRPAAWIAVATWGVVLTAAPPAVAGSPAAAATPDSSALARSVEELRHAVGRWNVTTEFLNPDGSVAHTAEGTYEFSWVVPDRVLSGVSEVPATGDRGAILFYVNESKGIIQMVSVHGDGHLWVMTGPLGGSTRATEEFPTAGGGTAQYRFTGYNMQADSFESRMEYTEDGGETWTQGNHQTFRRAPGP